MAKGISLPVELYFITYIVYCLWARFDDVRQYGAVRAGLGVTLDVALIVPAAIYWWGEPVISPLPLWLGLYVVGCTSVLISCIRGFTANFPDTSLSRKENIGLALAGFLLVFVVTGPALFWGGRWLLQMLLLP